MSPTSKVRHHVAIIGAGMAGLLMAIRLKQRGVTDFVLYEKADDVGGTWRDNTYPGIACDVPAHHYCYSFAPNAEWSSRYPSGAEIQRYFKDTARRFGVLQHVRLNTGIDRAEWDGKRWRLETTAGERVEADIVVASTGILHQPQYPDIPGLETFAGAAFHTSRWDHSVDLAGKRVGVIGTGSTAAQVIPAIAPVVEKLSVFQRTPQWILPIPNRRYSEADKARVRRFPIIARALYHYYAWKMDQTFGRTVVGEGDLEALRAMCLAFLETIEDPGLRAKLTPDYEPGCKRLVFSNRFYRTIQQPNVELVTDGIQRVEPEGVVTRDGRLHSLDALVLSTGFKSDAFMRPMTVVGAGGIDLDTAWAQRPRAYRSVAVPGMPNLFMTIGPHSPVGNLSLVQVAEAQVDYIDRLIKRIERSGQALAPTDQATDERIEAMRRAMSKTLWSSGCQSWYLDAEGYPGIYPWRASRFLKDMRRPIRRADFRDWSGRI